MIYKGKELEEHKGKNGKNFIDLTGKTFGEWFVICRAPNHITIGGTIISEFWCECSCGYILKIRSKRLRTLGNDRCKRCAVIKSGKERAKFYNDIPIDTFNKIEIQAKKRNLEFNITIKELWSLFLKQNKKCALSGIDIGFCVKQSIYKTNGWKARWVHTASLDRIDNSRGYTIDNIQWVHKDLNYMKQDYSEEYCYNMWKKYIEVYEKKIIDNQQFT